MENRNIRQTFTTLSEITQSRPPVRFKWDFLNRWLLTGDTSAHGDSEDT